MSGARLVVQGALHSMSLTAPWLTAARERWQVLRVVDVACSELDLALDAALVLDLTALVHTMSRTVSPVSRHVRKLLHAAGAHADHRPLRPDAEVPSFRRRLFLFLAAPCLLQLRTSQ